MRVEQPNVQRSAKRMESGQIQMQPTRPRLRGLLSPGPAPPPRAAQSPGSVSEGRSPEARVWGRLYIGKDPKTEARYVD